MKFCVTLLFYENFPTRLQKQTNTCRFKLSFLSLLQNQATASVHMTICFTWYEHQIKSVVPVPEASQKKTTLWNLPWSHRAHLYQTHTHILYN